jgi:hypothetical protein
MGTLSDYVPRYAVVAGRAGTDFGYSVDDDLCVVERVVTRSGGADFGVPTAILETDPAEVPAKEAARTAALLEASWQIFDEIVRGAPPTLRKGPRGGGRDRDAIVDHVASAEQMFAGKVGIKLPVPRPGRPEVVLANRVELLEWCRSGRSRPGARAGWPPRYAARRLIWHVLDHAWEIEDRRQ